MTISDIIHKASIYSVLIPLITGFFHVGRWSITDKLMIGLLTLASVPQLASAFEISKENKFILYNFYTIADAFIWGLVFFYNINSKIKYWTIVFFAFFLFGFIYLSVRENISKRFFSELVCLDNFIQVILVSIYFYQVYKKENIYQIELSSVFWFCVGILIYAPTTYFLFAFREIINSNKNQYNYLWSMHDVLNTIFFICMAAGLFMSSKKFIKTS